MIRAQDCRVGVACVGNEEEAIAVLNHEPADGFSFCAAGWSYRNPAIRIDAVGCRNWLVGRDAFGGTTGAVDVVDLPLKLAGLVWGVGVILEPLAADTFPVTVIVEKLCPADTGVMFAQVVVASVQVHNRPAIPVTVKPV